MSESIKEDNVANTEQRLDFFSPFSQFVSNISQEASQIVETAGQFISESSGKMGEVVENIGAKIEKKADEMVAETSKIADNLGQSVAAFSKETGKVADEIGKKTEDVDLFNEGLRKKAIEDYNLAVNDFEEVSGKLSSASVELFAVRKEGYQLVKLVEEQINQLANTPKEFQVRLEEIECAIDHFERKENEIKQAEIQVKAARGGAGVGTTLGAMGIAVATMGPTAAMGVATTFGVASTGTAISALSGAAANSAALAWLGGGALAAGGGGMTAGSAFLALAGPVGWTIAGVAGITALSSGIYAHHKNKELANELADEIIKINTIIQQLNLKRQEVEELMVLTQKQIESVRESSLLVTGRDYSLFSESERLQAGILVNSTLSLAQMIDKELSLDGEI